MHDPEVAGHRDLKTAIYVAHLAAASQCRCQRAGRAADLRPNRAEVDDAAAPEVADVIRANREVLFGASPSWYTWHHLTVPPPFCVGEPRPRESCLKILQQFAQIADLKDARPNTHGSTLPKERIKK
jgi:hypothetical protein